MRKGLTAIITAIVMNRIFLLSASVVCIVLLGSCSRDDAPQTHYQSTPVTADGQTDDWSLPLRFINPPHTLAFNVTNDAKNIYVVVMTKDERMQQRILRAGMDVFFDPKGKQNHSIGLSYPESNTDPNDAAFTTPNPKAALLNEASVYNTSGFLNVENGQFNVNDKTTQIRIAMSFHSDSTLVYEAIVPLYTLLRKGALDPKTLKKNFSVGIVVGNLPDRSANNRNQGGGGGFRPRMGFGMGGMGMGGGGMRGGGGNRNSNTNNQPKDESDWYTFRFATGASVGAARPNS